jgi:hypothetical protein
MLDPMPGIRARWFVMGEWALDPFHGRQTREHEDLEIATPMWHFDLIRERLSGSSSRAAKASGPSTAPARRSSSISKRWFAIRRPGNGGPM